VVGQAAFVGGTAKAETSAKPRTATFDAAIAAEVGGLFPRTPLSADFTGDDIPDIAVSVSSTQQVPGLAILVGDGRGGLTDLLQTTLPGNARACDLAAGDLDRNGTMDLAVATCESGPTPVWLLLGNGDGTFEQGQQVDGGTLIAHPAIGDLDGDGKPDLVVGKTIGGSTIYFGKGNGSVAKPRDYPNLNTSHVDPLDVTGDGALDLALPGLGTMVNNGDGTFTGPRYPSFSSSGGAYVDLDEDGNLDGAGVDGSGRHVYVGAGQGDGSYDLVTTLELPVTQTTSIAGGDFTGDGHGDLIVNGDGPMVYLLAGRGDFSFDAPVAFATGSQQLTTGDLDGSPAVDLLSVTTDPGLVYTALGGPRGLGAARQVPSAVPGELALGDVNGDGRTDVVTAGGILPADGGIWSALGANLNRGKGRFSATVVTRVREESAGAGVAALTLADVNGDG